MGFASLQKQDIFLSSRNILTYTWSIQTPIQWVPEFSLRSVKLTEREADEPSLFSSQIKNEWSYNLLPTYAFKNWRWSTLPLPFRIRDFLDWLNASTKISILWHFCRLSRVFWYVYNKRLRKAAVSTFVTPTRSLLIPVHPSICGILGGEWSSLD